MKQTANNPFIIWNAAGNQRIYPHGKGGQSEFETREEANRERIAFHLRMLEFGVVPCAEVKRLDEVSEYSPALDRAVRGPWNNCD